MKKILRHWSFFSVKTVLLLPLTLLILLTVAMGTGTIFSTSGAFRQQIANAASSPQAPVITSVDLSSEAVAEGTKLTLTVRAESTSPVNWLNRSFYGPHGDIYGGGMGTTFVEVSPGLWEHIWTDTVSKYAPSGTYSYTGISVENAGMLASEIWPHDVSIDIVNHIPPQAPMITSVDLSSEAVAEGTKLTLTVRAESNSPVNWLNRSFYGPHGNIYGGGAGRTFTEVSPGLWEHIWTDTVSKYAPSGTYSYTGISVENAGMLASEIWPHPLSIEVLNSADSGVLSVNIFPSFLDRDGAMWSVDGGESWWASGSRSLPAGIYTVAFSDIPGWDAPAKLVGVEVRPGLTAVQKA